MSAAILGPNVKVALESKLVGRFKGVQGIIMRLRKTKSYKRSLVETNLILSFAYQFRVFASLGRDFILISYTQQTVTKKLFSAQWSQKFRSLRKWEKRLYSLFLKVKRGPFDDRQGPPTSLSKKHVCVCVGGGNCPLAHIKKSLPRNQSSLA